jgi:predicted DsbA family dithiol-disulfide isomerase
MKSENSQLNVSVGQDISSEFDVNSLENTESVETGLKPTKDNRKKFDIDLAYGQMHEDQIIEMLQDKKIEVKTERGMWTKTGNIAIEFESYGKPSGINATESDYWFHRLAVDDDVFCTLVFDVPTLKKIVEKLDYHKVVKGGDNYASKMFLVNLSKLFSTDTLKLYRQLSTEV